MIEPRQQARLFGGLYVSLGDIRLDKLSKVFIIENRLSSPTKNAASKD